jgi:parvulin-like peptidyl-prolyl isomerase
MKKIVSVLALVVFLVGCSSKSEIDNRAVLKAGQLALTVNDLESVFSKANFKGPQDEFDRKKKFLEQQLDKMLIADAGLEIGLADSVEVDSVQQRRVLMEILYKKNITDKLDYSEDQVRKFWERYGGEIKASHILVKTKGLADSLYQVIMNNPDTFFELANQYSEDNVTRDKGGELGYIQIGNMSKEFDEVAFTLKSGEISKPVETLYGWHIIKVSDRIKHEPENFEENKGVYRKFSTWYQKQKLSEALEKEIKREQHYKIIDETLVMLREKAAKLMEVSENRANAYLSAEDLTPDEAQMPLAKAGELTLTAGEFIEQKKEKFSSPGYDLMDRTAIDSLASEALMPEMMYVYAKQIGLDKSHEYLHRFEDTRNGFVYRIMEKNYIHANVTVTDEEMKEFYKQGKKMYVEPARVRVSEILVETEDEANRILDQLRGGVPFSELAQKTIRPGYAEKGGDLGYIGPRDNSIIYNQAVKMKIGEMSGLVQMGTKYAVLKVTDKKPERQKDFSEVENQIRARVMGKKKLENMKRWQDERKKKVDHFIDLDLVKATLKTGKLEDEI